LLVYGLEKRNSFAHLETLQEFVSLVVLPT